jgi:uncharacterized protein
MSFFDKIQGDLNDAIKSKDLTSVSTLRLVISNLKNAIISKGSDLTDEEVIAEIAKDAKKHKESISVFEKAGRDDLAQKEKAEAEVLSKYLPEQMSSSEITKVVEEVISNSDAKSPADIGKVMGQVMSKFKGMADGETVSAIVREKLSA